MRIIIVPGKGGVGKTTTTTALAVYLSSLGKKVAVIDRGRSWAQDRQRVNQSLAFKRKERN